MSDGPSTFTIGDDAADDFPEFSGAQERPEKSDARTGKPAAKPFPLMKLLGGLGIGAVVLLGGTIAYVSSNGAPKSNPNQFGAVPQPAMAQTMPPQAPVQVAQQVVPAMAAPAAPVQQSNTATFGAPQPATAPPAGPTANYPQMNSAGQLAPQAGGQAVQGAPVAAAAMAPQQQPQQLQAVQPQPQPSAPNMAQPANAQGLALPAATPGKVGDALAQNRPVARPTSTSQDARARIAEIEGTLGRLQKELKEMRESTRASDTRKEAVSMPPTRQAQVSDDAKPESDADQRSHASRVKAAKAQAKAPAIETEKVKQEKGYAVTGMIGGQGWITKKGGNDVNADASVVVGDALPDGRKVTMVDAKKKRIWLSDGKFIATEE